jgi:hypothetical protein
MASTAKILTSLHGRRVGIDAKGNLVVEGRKVPSMDDSGALKQIQITPAAVNATATLTAAQLLTGIITSTTAAAVSATLPTGALTDAAAGLDIDESFDWHVINTGASNAFTILAGTNHTIVGAAAVALSTTGNFRTRKTAVGTFVTYRL